MAQCVDDRARVPALDEGRQMGQSSLNAVLESRLRSRIAELEGQNSTLMEEKDRLSKQLATSQKTCDDVVSELSSVRLTHRQELAALHDEAAQVKLQMSDAQAVAGETRLQLEAARAEVHAVLAARESGSSGLRAKLCKCEIELEQKCKETAALSRKLIAADSLADALEQELKVMQQTLNKMAGRMQAQEAGLKLQERRVLEVIKVGEKLAEQVECKTTALAATQLQVKELQQQKLAAEEQHVERQQQLEQHVQQAQQQLQDIQAENHSLQAQLEQQEKDKHTEVKQLSAQLQQLKAKHVSAHEHLLLMTAKVAKQQAAAEADISNIIQQRDACVLAMVLCQQSSHLRYSKLCGMLRKASAVVVAAKEAAAVRAAEATNALAAAAAARDAQKAAEAQAKEAEAAAAQAKAAEATANKAVAAAKAEAVVARAEAAQMHKALQAAKSEAAADVKVEPSADPSAAAVCSNKSKPTPLERQEASVSGSDSAAADGALSRDARVADMNPASASASPAAAGVGTVDSHHATAAGLPVTKSKAAAACVAHQQPNRQLGTAAFAAVAAVPSEAVASKRPLSDGNSTDEPAATRQKTLQHCPVQQQQQSDRPMFVPASLHTLQRGVPVLLAPQVNASVAAPMHGQAANRTFREMSISPMHQPHLYNVRSGTAGNKMQGYPGGFGNNSSSSSNQHPHLTTAASLMTPASATGLYSKGDPTQHQPYPQQQQHQQGNSSLQDNAWQPQQQQQPAPSVPRSIKLPALKMSLTADKSSAQRLGTGGGLPRKPLNQQLLQQQMADCQKLAATAKPVMGANCSIPRGTSPAAAAYRTFSASMGAHPLAVPQHAAAVSPIASVAAAAAGHITAAPEGGAASTAAATHASVDDTAEPAGQNVHADRDTYRNGGSTLPAEQQTAGSRDSNATETSDAAAARASVEGRSTDASVIAADDPGARTAAATHIHISCQQQNTKINMSVAAAGADLPPVAAAVPAPRAPAQPTTAMGLLFCALADDSEDDDSSSQMSARGVL